MPCKAILFDLDGTLLDTLEDIADATNRALVDNGFPSHPLDAYRDGRVTKVKAFPSPKNTCLSETPPLLFRSRSGCQPT